MLPASLSSWWYFNLNVLLAKLSSHSDTSLKTLSTSCHSNLEYFVGVEHRKRKCINQGMQTTVRFNPQSSTARDPFLVHDSAQHGLVWDRLPAVTQRPWVLPSVAPWSSISGSQYPYWNGRAKDFRSGEHHIHSHSTGKNSVHGPTSHQEAWKNMSKLCVPEEEKSIGIGEWYILSLMCLIKHESFILSLFLHSHDWRFKRESLLVIRFILLCLYPVFSLNF